MSDLLISFISALLSTNQPMALSQLVEEKTGLPASIVTTPDPLRAAYERLLAEDDLAQEQVDRWIKESQSDTLTPTSLQQALLQARIEERLNRVRKSYQDFIDRHPDYAPIRLAFGSFLNDIQDEEEALKQWEKARELDPNEPAAWNNLANYYGHNGPVEKAFAYYEKAIALKPAQSVYYQNLATTVYMFRRQAAAHYGLPIPEVLEKSMKLYERALQLDPHNFILASEVAQTYYGLQPAPLTSGAADAKDVDRWGERALAAWKHAMSLARDEAENQGVRIHLARIKIEMGRYAEARQDLNAVTNALLQVTRRNLMNKLDDRERQGGEGNAAPTAD